MSTEVVDRRQKFGDGNCGPKTEVELNDFWMQETTQRRIKPVGLLLPDLLIKKCSYQTSL